MTSKLESLNHSVQKIVQDHGEARGISKKKSKSTQKNYQDDSFESVGATIDTAQSDQAKITKVFDMVDRIKTIIKKGDSSSEKPEKPENALKEPVEKVKRALKT